MSLGRKRRFFRAAFLTALFAIPAPLHAESLFDQLESQRPSQDGQSPAASHDVPPCSEDLFAHIGRSCDLQDGPEDERPADEGEPARGIIALPDVTVLHAFALTLPEPRARFELQSKESGDRSRLRRYAVHRFKDRTRFVFRAPAMPGAYDMVKHREPFATITATLPGPVVVAPSMIDRCDETFSFRFRGPRMRDDRIVLRRKGAGRASPPPVPPIDVHVHLPATQTMRIPEISGAYELTYETPSAVFFTHALTVVEGSECAQRASQATNTAALTPDGLRAAIDKRRGPASFVALDQLFAFENPPETTGPRIILDRNTLSVCEPIKVSWAGPASIRNRFAGSSFSQDVDGVRSLAIGPVSSADVGPYADGQDIYDGIGTVTLYAPSYPGEFEIRYLDFTVEDSRTLGALFLAAELVTVTPGDRSACETMKALRQARNSEMAAWIRRNGRRIEP